MHEIITLQLGTWSNYVATHFWNAQESYFTFGDGEGAGGVGAESVPPGISHDVHWRAGIGSDGSDTFLPRTVIYDRKESFGSLRKINALYEPNNDVGPFPGHTSWSGAQVVQKLPSVPPSEYIQSLEANAPRAKLTASSVRYWSDYSRVYFHPRSIIPVYDDGSESAHGSSATWECGHQRFCFLERDEELIDRDWRPFAEECDHMQGINLITSIDDDWGGFASAYIERLRDEYGKCCIWTWGLQRPNLTAGTPEQRRSRVATLNSIVSLSSSSTTFVPLAHHPELHSPHLVTSLSSKWDMSALMATGLETASLASRLTGPAGGVVSQLNDLSEDLDASGHRPVAKLRVNVGPLDGGYWRRGLDSDDGVITSNSDWMDLSYFTCLASGRGLRHGVRRPNTSHMFGRVIMTRGADLEDGCDEIISSSRTPFERTISHGCALDFPLPDSFPRIYEASHAENGIQVRTILSTESSLAADFQGLEAQARRLIGLEDREAMASSLGDMADAYKEGWTSDAEDDYD